jgi:hypothetical protein
MNLSQVNLKSASGRDTAGSEGSSSNGQCLQVRKSYIFPRLILVAFHEVERLDPTWLHIRDIHMHQTDNHAILTAKDCLKGCGNIS